MAASPPPAVTPDIFALWDGTATNGEVPSTDPAPYTGSDHPYALAALHGICDDIAGMAPYTGRDSALNAGAYRMAGFIVAGHIDERLVYDQLYAAGRTAGQSDAEVRRVLRDGGGLTTGKANPKIIPPREPVPEPSPFVVPEGTPDEVAEQAAKISAFIRTHFPLIDWQLLWDTEDEEDEWVLYPLIPSRRLVALFSAPKVGKSLLMLEIAVGVARGTYVLGVTPDRPRRVLYVDFENDPRGDIRVRLQSMGTSPEELDNLCYLSFPTLAKLDTAAGATELMAIVAEYGCELVVIDTISRAVGGEENDNDTWLAFYRHTGLAMKQAGVACIRLDHTGKDHEKGMRGGSAKYGDVDAVWKLARVTDDVFQLECTDTRMRIVENVVVVRRCDNPLRHEVAGAGRTAAWDAETAALVETMDHHDLADDISRVDARDVLKLHGVRAGNETYARAVKLRKRRKGLHFSDQETEL